MRDTILDLLLFKGVGYIRVVIYKNDVFTKCYGEHNK